MIQLIRSGLGRCMANESKVTELLVNLIEIIPDPTFMLKLRDWLSVYSQGQDFHSKPRFKFYMRSQWHFRSEPLAQTIARTQTDA